MKLGTYKHISTLDAKKTAIKDIIASSDKDNSKYINLLTMSLERQLEYLPKECRISIDEIDIDKNIRIYNPGDIEPYQTTYKKETIIYSIATPLPPLPEIKNVFVVAKFNQKKCQFKDKFKSSYIIKSSMVSISAECYLFMISFGIKFLYSKNGEVKYIDAVKLVRHKRSVSKEYLKNHSINAINEYSNFMTKVAKKCETFYENFDVNDYEK
jgi:hypothetical protein